RVRVRDREPRGAGARHPAHGAPSPRAGGPGEGAQGGHPRPGALLRGRRGQVPEPRSRCAAGDRGRLLRRAHRGQLPAALRRRDVRDRRRPVMLDALKLPFFQYAALAALVLAGIHAYLGFHIVRRGVLFVDLALAQMAALGVALAVVLGREHDPVGSYLLALGMTLVGAALFAWLRGRARHAPLEAFIGIVFATA